MKYLITAKRIQTAYQRAEFEVEAEDKDAALEAAKKLEAEFSINWEDGDIPDPDDAEFEIEEAMPDPEDQPVPAWAKAMVSNYRELANIPASVTDWRIYLESQEIGDLGSDEKIEAMRQAFAHESPEA
jgi:hypothetical protein